MARTLAKADTGSTAGHMHLSLSVPVFPPNCSFKWQKPVTREAFDLREKSKCSPLSQGHRQASREPPTVVTENGPEPRFLQDHTLFIRHQERSPFSP